MKVLYVEWWDAVAESGWQVANEIDDAHLCITVGHLVRETKLSISLAATVSDKEVNAVQTIPKAWIKKKKVVMISGQKKK